MRGAVKYSKGLMHFQSLLILCLSAISLNTPLYAQNFTFDQWKKELMSEASSFLESEELRIEDLPSEALLIALYPKRLSVTVLSWVGAGGSLFLTLNATSVSAAEDVMNALDLEAEINGQREGEWIVGAWPFPIERERPSRGQHLLLAPWLTWRPLSFVEGTSWYKGDIPPIAIDERGHSLGYRVRYGRGTLTLLGDGDALSDQMRVIAENRRFSQSVMSMIASRTANDSERQYTRDHLPSDRLSITKKDLPAVYYVSPGGEILSTVEESSFTHHLKTLMKSLRAWVKDQSESMINLYNHLQYALFLLLGLTWLSLSRLFSQRKWKNKIIVRRR